MMFSLLPLVLVGRLEGAKARNWLFHIVVDPDKGDAAVYAQELRELLYKLPRVSIPVLLALLGGLAAFLTGRAGDWAPIVGLAVAVGLLVWSRTTAFTVPLELRGQSAEIAARTIFYAPEGETELARAGRIARLIAENGDQLRYGYSGFKGKKVELMLAAELPAALAWVKARRSQIERFKREVR